MFPDFCNCLTTSSVVIYTCASWVLNDVKELQHFSLFEFSSLPFSQKQVIDTRYFNKRHVRPMDPAINIFPLIENLNDQHQKLSFSSPIKAPFKPAHGHHNKHKTNTTTT